MLLFLLYWYGQCYILIALFAIVYKYVHQSSPVCRPLKVFQNQVLPPLINFVHEICFLLTIWLKNVY